jgi:hypothetical protein
VVDRVVAEKRVEGTVRERERGVVICFDGMVDISRRAVAGDPALTLR